MLVTVLKGRFLTRFPATGFFHGFLFLFRHLPQSLIGTDDARRQKDKEIRLRICLFAVFKKPSQQGNIAQNRNFGLVFRLVIFYKSTETTVSPSLTATTVFVERLV